MKTSTLTCLTFALLLLATRSASAVDVFIYQPNINAAYNAVLDARMKLETSPSFITPDTIKKVRSKLVFAKICLEKAKKNKGSHRPSAIALIDNAQKELEAMTGNMSHHERARQLVKNAFEQVHQAGRAGAR
jgi:hypothetical protein